MTAFLTSAVLSGRRSGSASVRRDSGSSPPPGKAHRVLPADDLFPSWKCRALRIHSASSTAPSVSAPAPASGDPHSTAGGGSPAPPAPSRPARPPFSGDGTDCTPDTRAPQSQARVPFSSAANQYGRTAECIRTREIQPAPRTRHPICGSSEILFSSSAPVRSAHPSDKYPASSALSPAADSPRSDGTPP